MNARDPHLPLQADETGPSPRSPTGAGTRRSSALTDYIAVPAKSPMFDADWRAHGLIDRVVRDAAAWVESRKVPGLRLEVIRLEGRTRPVVLRDPGHAAAQRRHGLMYGHLDKQPEFNGGWRTTSKPLDARSSRTACCTAAAARTTAYAVYAAITAVEALDRQGIPHPRIVGLIESEESGADLPAYLDLLRPRLGQVGLVVASTPGAGNYDQLWLTTSLRGMVSGVLKVEILTEGHATPATPVGLVPSSFRILRQVLTG